MSTRQPLQGGALNLGPTNANSVRSHLTALGHTLAERVEPAGGAQVIWINHSDGVLSGASDSRKDGCAIGY